MPKANSSWSDRSGSASVTQVKGDLLLEDGISHLLLEDGVTYLALEDIMLTPKEASIWDQPPAKSASSWYARDGSTSVTQANVGVIRTLQDGVTQRVLQDGITTRILNDNVVTPKEATLWDNL